MGDEVLHPCQTCGACCAYFRVSFYWREAEEPVDDRLAPVPVELTDERGDFYRTMKGTSSKHHSRCVALEGKVGETVGCSIYSLRPTPCRDFQASFEDGTHQPRCDQARAKYGLAPLSRKDWGFACGNPAVTIKPHETLEIS
ncbi:MAG: YkgJ family cysteine cluster protein [Bdellovibrionota bacterium]